MKDYYQILGIEKTASLSEIKKAYRKLSTKFHPDKNLGDDYFTKFFLDVQEAYDVLSNQTKRSEYDNKQTGKSSASKHQIKKPKIITFKSDKKQVSDSDNIITITWVCTNARSVRIGNIPNLGVKGQKKIRIKRKNNTVNFTEVKLICYGYYGQIDEQTIVVYFKNITQTDTNYSNQSEHIFSEKQAGTNREKGYSDPEKDRKEKIKDVIAKCLLAIHLMCYIIFMMDISNATKLFSE